MCSQTAKSASTHAQLLTTAINKMAPSYVAGYVGDQIAELKEQQTIASASVALLSLVSANASSNPGDFIEHVAVLRQCPPGAGVGLGSVDGVPTGTTTYVNVERH